ncbi:MAG TPA: hypothetical protein V6D05_14325 [Stenomitos sp.]
MSEQRDPKVERRPVGLAMSPGMLLEAPGADLYAQGVQERLDHCADYYLPFTLVGIFLDDLPLGTGSLLTPDLRAQLFTRAKSLIQRSVRSTPNERRKITDGLYRLDPLYVVALCNADRSTHLIPVGRMIEALRQASLIHELNGRTAFRRRIVVGTVSLDPRQGGVRLADLTERLVEAVMKAAEAPLPDACERMRIGRSIHDEILYHDLGWAEDKVRPVDVIPRSVTQPIARAHSGPISSRAAVPVVRSASAPIKGPDPKKPFWRFW